MRLNFDRKSALGLLAAILLVIAAGTAAYLDLHQFRDTVKHVSHSHKVLLKLEHIRSLMQDEQIGVRGFVITGDARSLETYFHTRAVISDELGGLRRLTSDNPAYQARIQELETLIRQRFDLSEQIINQRKTAGAETGEVLPLVTHAAQYMERIRGIVDAIETGETRFLEERTRRAEADSRMTLMTLGVFGTLGVVAIVAFVMLLNRELGRSQQFEHALRREEERLRSIMDNSPLVIFLKDTEGRHQFVNQEFLDAFRLDRSRVIGRTDREIFPPEIADKFMSNDREVMATGHPAQFEETASRDGAPHIYSVAKFPLREPGGRIYAICGMAADITERKKAEETIRGLSDSLISRTQQLEAANHELEAFSYSVSHDLRAPLRSINGFSQALIEDYRDKLEPAAQDYLNRIMAATRRMGQLIDDLLELSRVTRAEMCGQWVDLSALARSVMDELRQSAPGREVHATIKDGISVWGDTRLLRVILANLLGNAWKFTAKTPCPSIEFGSIVHPDGTATIFVRDNGAGFDMAHAKNLFGVFQRLHSTSEFEGTGIGLATVRRIVQRHGGMVRGEGRPGEGAVFYFTLGSPRISAEGEADEQQIYSAG